jgi:iron complex transport system substrate-binding protein
MIELAGGVDPLGKRGEKSRTISWGEAAAARPDVAVVMPCGLYADEALEQAAGYREELEAIGARQIFAVDAAAAFSRPGPRLADGTELLAHLLHPDRVPAPVDLAWRPVAAAPVG